MEMYVTSSKDHINIVSESVSCTAHVSSSYSASFVNGPRAIVLGVERREQRHLVIHKSSPNVLDFESWANRLIFYCTLSTNRRLTLCHDLLQSAFFQLRRESSARRLFYCLHEQAQNLDSFGASRIRFDCPIENKCSKCTSNYAPRLSSTRRQTKNRRRTWNASKTQAHPQQSHETFSISHFPPRLIKSYGFALGDSMKNARIGSNLKCIFEEERNIAKPSFSSSSWYIEPVCDTCAHVFSACIDWKSFAGMQIHLFTLKLTMIFNNYHPWMLLRNDRKFWWLSGVKETNNSNGFDSQNFVLVPIFFTRLRKFLRHETCDCCTFLSRFNQRISMSSCWIKKQFLNRSLHWKIRNRSGS